MAFLQRGGKRAVITSIATIEDAVAGKAGTEIVHDLPQRGDWKH